MLATDVRDYLIVVAAPHRHGGVANMLVALGNANVHVSRIAPSDEEGGVYCLTVADQPQRAVTILEGIGWKVAARATTRSEPQTHSHRPLPFG